MQLYGKIKTAQCHAYTSMLVDDLIEYLNEVDPRIYSSKFEPNRLSPSSPQRLDVAKYVCWKHCVT